MNGKFQAAKLWAHAVMTGFSKLFQCLPQLNQVYPNPYLGEPYFWEPIYVGRIDCCRNYFDESELRVQIFSVSPLESFEWIFYPKEIVENTIQIVAFAWSCLYFNFMYSKRVCFTRPRWVWLHCYVNGKTHCCNATAVCSICSRVCIPIHYPWSTKFLWHEKRYVSKTNSGNICA